MSVACPYLSISSDHVGLKSVLSVNRMAVPPYFLVLFAWNAFSHPLTLRFGLSLMVRYIFIGGSKEVGPTF